MFEKWTGPEAVNSLRNQSEKEDQKLSLQFPDSTLIRCGNLIFVFGCWTITNSERFTVAATCWISRTLEDLKVRRFTQVLAIGSNAIKLWGDAQLTSEAILKKPPTRVTWWARPYAAHCLKHGLVPRRTAKTTLRQTSVALTTLNLMTLKTGLAQNPLNPKGPKKLSFVTTSASESSLVKHSRMSAPRESMSQASNVFSNENRN